jgi:hypothetical protein
MERQVKYFSFLIAVIYIIVCSLVHYARLLKYIGEEFI